MEINLLKCTKAKKPFVGVAFLFSVFLANFSCAQSSSDFMKTMVNENGKLHFIKPIEFNAVAAGNSFTADITVTQAADSIDSAMLNFTFTTKSHAPRVDSVHVTAKSQQLAFSPIVNYYVDKKGSKWVSRNGFRLSRAELREVLSSPDIKFFIYPRAETTAVEFDASADWKKMQEIISQVLFY